MQRNLLGVPPDFVMFIKISLKEWFLSLLRERTAELVGYVLICVSIFLMLCLVSYHPSDPSFNRATSEEALNFGGALGAYMSDLLLQIMGLACIWLALVPLGWGIKLLSQKDLPHPPLRIAALFAAIPTVAALFAWLPAPLSWPIVNGLGGFLGVFVKTKLVGLATSPGALAVALLWSLIMLYAAFGNRIRDWIIAWSYCRSTVERVRPALEVICRLWSDKQEPKAERSFRIAERTPKAEEETEAPSSKAEKKRVEAPAPRKKKAEPKEAQPSFSLRDGFGNFQLPPLNILSQADGKVKRPSEASLEQNARLLESVLNDFGVNGEITKVRPGPVVTLYELEPSPGTKSSRVVGLSDDISRSMSAISTRIAVIPGRNAIGIELPNTHREMVNLRELFEDPEFTSEEKSKLGLALGKDIGGEPVVADLAKMPHLLVAGTTGSGKSVAINTMILSLLYRLTPEECRFIMIDPKMLELSMYDGIPHLLAPVVTEPGKAVVALKWTVKEMENRYRLMSNLGVRNIDGYNKRILEAKSKGSILHRSVQTGYDVDTGKPIIEEVPLDMSPLPYIVVIVDEMADLMLVAGKDIETSIQRLAQMARAAGIHIIMATQRPSVDVITGVIKANFPTRISFQVTSRIDSRTILGEQGAETLLGQGDMLYMAGGGRITRVHGPFVSDHEVETVVAFLKAQGAPQYIETVTQDDEETAELQGLDGGAMDGEEGLYQQAVQIIKRDRKVSTSYVQRVLRIGYNRAADIMDRMEREGIISAPNHAGKRELLVE